MDEIVASIQSNADWSEGTWLPLGDARELLAGIKDLKQKLSLQEDRIKELENDLADAWAQVLHG